MTNSKTISGGSKKSNGHKMDCKCPICKNMNKNKKGGDDELIEEAAIDNNDGDIEENEEVMKMEGGKHKKKGNGHKADCGCPICKNMRKSKKQSGGEENMDETEVVTDTNGDEVSADIEEEQTGGKKRKTRKIKRKSSKRKTKRRKSKRKSKRK